MAPQDEPSSPARTKKQQQARPRATPSTPAWYTRGVRTPASRASAAAVSAPRVITDPPPPTRHARRAYTNVLVWFDAPATKDHGCYTEDHGFMAVMVRCAGYGGRLVALQSLTAVEVGLAADVEVGAEADEPG